MGIFATGCFKRRGKLEPEVKKGLKLVDFSPLLTKASRDKVKLFFGELKYVLPSHVIIHSSKSLVLKLTFDLKHKYAIHNYEFLEVE